MYIRISIPLGEVHTLFLNKHTFNRSLEIVVYIQYNVRDRCVTILKETQVLAQHQLERSVKER